MGKADPTNAELNTNKIRICMVIPVYKEVPDQEEMQAINNAESKFSREHIYFVCPESLKADVYTVGGFGKQTFPDRYFTSEKAYSKLLLKPDFYQRFLDMGYTHMLICQTDVWLIGTEQDVYALLRKEETEGRHWSYYGAPWPAGRWVYSRAFRGLSAVKILFHGRILYSGNGGFSLRNLEDSVRLLKSKKCIANTWNSGEDVFFSYHGNDDKAKKIGFTVAPAQIAAKLALEEDARAQITGGFVPIGIHAWRKYYPEFQKEGGSSLRPAYRTVLSGERFDVPIVMIVFNRPGLSEKLAKQIARVQPRKVYVIADHARENVPGEKEKTEAVLRAVLRSLPESCEVIVDQATTNMGCDGRITDGLTRVFQKEERAIILEDDCFPHLSFFAFAREMLERYRNDRQVKFIAGSNQIDTFRIDDSYAFTYNAWTWGWATWARTWNEMLPLDKEWYIYRNRIRQLKMLSGKERREYRKTVDTYAKRGRIPWDYVFGLSVLFQGGLSIVPKTNLIINDGFGEDATHTGNGIAGYYPQVVPVSLPLTHPVEIREVPGYHRAAYKWHRETILHKLCSPAFYKRVAKRLLKRQ